jgi:cytochrome c5
MKTVFAVAIAAFATTLLPMTPLGAQAPANTPALAPPASPGAAPPRAVFDKYCVTCHNERLRVANLTLDKMDLDQVGGNADVWEKVIRKLRSGAMPPPRMPRPDATAYDSTAGWLETALDRAAEQNLNPGRPALHRLNRAEYTNAIRDLLALDIDGPTLMPTDESGFGFDNIADVLSLSPVLLDRYMSAAQKVSRMAIGDATLRSAGDVHTISLGLVQDDRMSEEMPFGTRGGTVIRRAFPVDGEYLIKIRLRRGFNTGIIRGLGRREQLDVLLDGVRIKRFTLGGECVDSTEPRCQREAGRLDGATPLASVYEQTADEGLEFRFVAKTGVHQVAVTFVQQTTLPEGAWSKAPAALAYSTDDFDGPMELRTVEFQGPVTVTGSAESSSRKRIFVCRPRNPSEDGTCAKKILSTLARRAYRRPATDRDVQALWKLYQVGRRDGNFDSGIQLALEGLLVSPNFLFRIEVDPAGVAPGAAYRLTDLELASRLSFYLWSSIPDEDLLEAAEHGKLKDPLVLEQQVRRMLRDPRASALITNFADQWLYLRNMRLVTPDPRQFPEFDENLRDAFQRETELFLEDQLRSDHSVVDLLSANYSFVNERLAKFYGISNVYGSHFRRVTLSNPNRFGLLSQGSILTVTSYVNRTTPTVRGKWVLENILGAPPPPPPPNVNTDLSEKPGEPATSIRQRLEAHRKNAVCASCHSNMDPVGFAFENFNGIGKWRTTDAGSPIDASGVLVDGTSFEGPAQFRNVLLTHGNQFVGTVAEKLLTYALGRGLEPYDQPVVRKILREAAPGDYRWSSLILGVTKSLPFQMRRAADPRPVETSASQNAVN